MITEAVRLVGVGILIALFGFLAKPLITDSLNFRKRRILFRTEFVQVARSPTLDVKLAMWGQEFDQVFIYSLRIENTTGRTLRGIEFELLSNHDAEEPFIFEPRPSANSKFEMGNRQAGKWILEFAQFGRFDFLPIKVVSFRSVDFQLFTNFDYEIIPVTGVLQAKKYQSALLVLMVVVVFILIILEYVIF